MQKFDPKNHITNIIDDDYYTGLVKIRSALQFLIDKYYRQKNVPKVDLYMVTGGVSSPMGKGSDSMPWPIVFGDRETNLVDSAQFGMEPLVQKGFNSVYCYLPSFRGEDPDDHHLNQFYHCEAELAGSLNNCMQDIEGLLKSIFKIFDDDKNNSLISADRKEKLKEVTAKPVSKLTFEQAIEILNNDSAFVNVTPYGRTISRQGEIELSKRAFEHNSLFWITNYDRDTVPFYQKPDPANEEKVLNADLILPPVGNVGFAGEVIGCGQRQDSAKEILRSMERQSVHGRQNYGWYINLRKRPDYVGTSGYGLGIERLLSWMIGTDDIASAALYPVMKNITTEY